MFQTDLHVWLQSFDAPWFEALMVQVSALGNRTFYLFVILLVIFGVELRRGFLAMQCLLWANFVTVWLKAFLDMPRPYHTNADLKVWGDVGREVRLPRVEPDGFFALPSADTLAQVRAGAEMDNGFPSGHMTVSTSFWAGLSVLSGYRLLVGLAAVFIALTFVSRMYLGVHFLADVLGGLVIGLLPVAIVWRAFLRRRQMAQWLYFELFSPQHLWLLHLGAPLVLLLLPQTHHMTLGQLFGTNLAFWLSCRHGFPVSRAVWWKRVLRFGVACSLFVGSELLLNLFFYKNDPGMLIFVRQAVQTFAVFYGGIRLSLWLRLFEGQMQVR